MIFRFGIRLKQTNLIEMYMAFLPKRLDVPSLVLVRSMSCDLTLRCMFIDDKIVVNGNFTLFSFFDSIIFDRQVKILIQILSFSIIAQKTLL